MKVYSEGDELFLRPCLLEQRLHRCLVEEVRRAQRRHPPRIGGIHRRSLLKEDVHVIVCGLYKRSIFLGLTGYQNSCQVIYFEGGCFSSTTTGSSRFVFF